MRKFLFWVAVVATIVAVLCGIVVVRLVRENRHLERVEHALREDVRFYRTASDRSAASVEALEMSVAEFRAERERDAEEIASLGIRLRRAESYAQSASTTTIADTVVVRDTVIVRDSLPRAYRYFAAADVWSRVEGIFYGDSVNYSVHSIDTLHQVIHRVPRKFWFIRYGTKAIRQDVWSSNPNTQLVYTEYIELPRRTRRR